MVNFSSGDIRVDGRMIHTTVHDSYSVRGLTTERSGVAENGYTVQLLDRKTLERLALDQRLSISRAYAHRRAEVLEL